MLKFDKLIFCVIIFISVSTASPVSIVFSEHQKESLVSDLVRSVLDTCSDLNQTLNRLSQLEEIGAVENYQVESDSQAVDVTVASAIRDIKVKGAFPLFVSEIEEILSLRAGDFVTPEKLELQKKLIVDRLALAGIISPVISIETKPAGKQGLVDLLVTIRDKQLQVVKGIEFRGTPQFGPLVHGWNFRAHHYRRFFFLPRRYFRDDLRDDTRKLREFYRLMGYADVEISTSDSVVSTLPTGTQVVVLQVTINSGDVHSVKLGNISPFSRRTVNDVFDMKRQGNRSIGVIRSGSTRLKNYLSDLGYDSSTVTITDTTVIRSKRYPWKNVIHQVSIEQGNRNQLASLQITGNSHFSSRELKNLCQTQKGIQKKRRYRGSFSPNIFRNDSLRVLQYMQGRGFPSASISTELSQQDPHRTSVVLTVTENDSCTVGSVKFKGISDSIRIRELLQVCKIKTNSLWDKSSLATDQKAIIQYFRDRHALSTEVVLHETLNADSTTVAIVWELKRMYSPIVRTVTWWGNFFTRKKYLNRSIDLHRKLSFSQRSLNESVRKLRALELFSSVTPEQIATPKKDSVDLLFRLEEQKRIDLFGAVGYETESDLYLRGTFLLNNLHGLNRRFKSDAEWNNVRRRLSLSIIEPNLFVENLSAEAAVTGIFEKKKNVDYGTRSIENSYSLGWNPRPGLLLSLNASYKVKRTVGVTSTDSNAQAVFQKNLHQLLNFSPAFTLDNRDSFVKPTKGGLVKVESTISHGLTTLIDDFWLLRVDSRLFVSVARPVTVALHLRGSFQRPYGKNHLTPGDEKFYLGGTSSVRGYGENLLYTDSLGKSKPGNVAIDGSVELRPVLFHLFEVPVFVDFGSISFTDQFTDLEQVKFSVGTGLRFNTPIGPIGVVYGWKIEPTQGQVAPGAFHYSIGYTF